MDKYDIENQLIKIIGDAFVEVLDISQKRLTHEINQFEVIKLVAKHLSGTVKKVMEIYKEQ